MKAILTYATTAEGKNVERTQLFDTNKAKKICDVENTYGTKVQEIYITKKNTLFLHDVKNKSLELVDQKECKKWIGEHEPDKYIKFYGEVEDA